MFLYYTLGRSQGPVDLSINPNSYPETHARPKPDSDYSLLFCQGGIVIIHVNVDGPLKNVKQELCEVSKSRKRSRVSFIDWLLNTITKLYVRVGWVAAWKCQGITNLV